MKTNLHFISFLPFLPKPICIPFTDKFYLILLLNTHTKKKEENLKTKYVSKAKQTSESVWMIIIRLFFFLSLILLAKYSWTCILELKGTCESKWLFFIIFITTLLFVYLWREGVFLSLLCLYNCQRRQWIIYFFFFY